MDLVRLAAGAALAVLLGGCGPREDGGDAPAPASGAGEGSDAPAAAGAVTRDGNRWSKTVSRADYGDAWPLVFDTATISCQPRSDGRLQILLVADEQGREFALNGTARGAGHRELRPVWLDDEKIPGLKIPVTRLMDDARALCP